MVPYTQQEHTQDKELAFQAQQLHMMNRRKTNLEIIQILTNYLIEYPDIRFTQALYNLGIATHSIEHIKECDTCDATPNYRDIFYEEPEKTLAKITFKVK